MQGEVLDHLEDLREKEHWGDVFQYTFYNLQQSFVSHEILMEDPSVLPRMMYSLNGKKFGGSVWECRAHGWPAENKNYSPVAEDKLFIEGLPLDVNQRELSRLVQDIDQLVDCCLMRSRHKTNAIIRLRTKEGTKEALYLLNNSSVRGHTIKVRYSTSTHCPSRRTANGSNSQGSRDSPRGESAAARLEAARVPVESPFSFLIQGRVGGFAGFRPAGYNPQPRRVRFRD